MTIEEVKAMTIGVMENKIPALCKKTRTGKVVPVRQITGEESAAITVVLYSLFKSLKPNEKYMTIPYGNGKVLAITEMEINPKAEQA